MHTEQQTPPTTTNNSEQHQHQQPTTTRNHSKRNAKPSPQRKMHECKQTQYGLCFCFCTVCSFLQLMAAVSGASGFVFLFFLLIVSVFSSSHCSHFSIKNNHFYCQTGHNCLVRRKSGGTARTPVRASNAYNADNGR